MLESAHQPEVCHRHQVAIAIRVRGILEANLEAIVAPALQCGQALSSHRHATLRDEAAEAPTQPTCGIPLTKGRGTRGGSRDVLRSDQTSIKHLLRRDLTEKGRDSNMTPTITEQSMAKVGEPVRG